MRTAFVVAVLLSVGCGASVGDVDRQEDSEQPAAVVAEAPSECTCAPVITQETSCAPHAVCTGAPACADIETREAAKQDSLAKGSEHYYFQGEVPSSAFTADPGDCAGTTVEDLPEALRVQPYDVDGCRCEVTIECDRVRTTTLACAP